jgi:hypothetical protein
MTAKKSLMDALDGNVIGGALFQHFGTEMTAAVGTCAHCGTSAQIGELVVYTRAPGTVVRCRHCLGVVMVLVSVRGELRIDSSAFRMDQPPGGG